MRRLLITFVSLLVTAPAFGQSGSLPTQQFAPAPGGDNNYVSVQGTGVLPSLKPAVGLYLNYALDPLILRRESTGEEVSLIQHQLQLDLIAAVGFLDILELGVAIPMTLYQAAGDNSATLQINPVDSFAMGDIRLYPKWSIVHDDKGFGAALLAVVTLPTGNPSSLQGNESVTLEPRVALQYVINDSFRAALTAGFIIRPEKQQVFNIDVGNELTFGAGIEYQPVPKEWAILAEVNGKVSTESGAGSEENPIEVVLAGRYWPAANHAITLGLGRGLTDGYGTPTIRAFLGYNYTAGDDPDPDGDGLLNEEDSCPDKPEDFDGFEDEDGCPDPDNDKDGIKDRRDGPRDANGWGSCMNDPEDFDGFEDEDGCPDPDNDKDGILDADDGPDGSCKNEPEDTDGFEDEDGCPDPDNDGDGVLDRADGEPNADGWGACMNDPEDKDGWQDEDGCPDPDNDGDGILDVDDSCPNRSQNDCGVGSINPCEIVITERVQFRYDKFEIDPKSFPLLDAVASVVLSQTWIKKLEVQGHTDSDGTNAYNIELSQNRSNEVMKYLTGKGVDAGRLVAKGYGEEVPIAKNTTAAGRKKNRRVQFVIIDPSQAECAEKAGVK